MRRGPVTGGCLRPVVGGRRFPVTPKAAEVGDPVWLPGAM